MDLGSNSFHMVVARLVDGQPHLVDRLRERVVLASGLGVDKRLSPEIQERALASLRRFGQRLRDMPPGSVRAVGTNALRQARNSRPFLLRARAALGHPIEVIPGREEARLIYLGVAHSLADDTGRRLVVDIGGGSTECILGERLQPHATDSLFMGCVTWTARHFRHGELKRAHLQAAIIAAQRELQSIERPYKAAGWDTCIGSSGTILSIDAMLRERGWDEDGITPRGLRRLAKTMLAARHVDRLSMPGLAPERAAVLPGGLAILLAVFESLGIERMVTSPSSLREGLLFDLIGRIRHEDVRERTIRQLTQRYRLDAEQGARVERTALKLLAGVARGWRLAGEEPARMLAWAARLHEIGLSVNYTGYHKHGAYIVAHGDMPGFSREDQQTLGALIAGHRRKLPPDAFAALPAARVELARHACVLLRLAVALNRGRSARPLPRLTLTATGESLRLAFPKGWLRRHPLTAADLVEEAALLAPAGISLRGA
ncbi:MAG TPA: Ppx/GppA phosphatase family protein [Planctomycetota bacterium]|nr:Ppx/GppA phosphatase family protein [Planctomycetota bacterium]